MGIKKHLLSAIRSAGMGGLLGYAFSYISAYNQQLPGTIEQFAHGLGMAGLTAGIISGALPIIIPYILMPQIMKINTVQRVVNSSSVLRKVVGFFSKKEEDHSP